MSPSDAAALLERVFPFEQCHPHPTTLMFNTQYGPHNYTPLRGVHEMNAYYFAERPFQNPPPVD